MSSSSNFRKVTTPWSVNMVPIFQAASDIKFAIVHEPEVARPAPEFAGLISQLSTIENQRFILAATGAVLLLVLLLIALIFRAYRGKHRLALQLEGVRFTVVTVAERQPAVAKRRPDLHHAGIQTGLRGADLQYVE